MPVGNFDGELNVETHPVQLDAQTTGDYWLAPYFTRWTGASLAPETRSHCNWPATRAAGPPGVVPTTPDVALTYGNSYEFRVRLADHTGDGPETADKPTEAAPAPVATHHFRRWVRLGNRKLSDRQPPMRPRSSFGTRGWAGPLIPAPVFRTPWLTSWPTYPQRELIGARSGSPIRTSPLSR